MAEPERPVMGPEPPPVAAAKEAAPRAHGDLSSNALFWGDGDDIDPDNPDMAALLALQEECTPEERAEAFKARIRSRLRALAARRLLHRGCECQQPSRSDAGVCAAQTQGNESVKRGSAFYMRQAAAFYTQAIEQRSGNAEQNSVYYSNRAHTQLQLRNWGKALSDAHAAVELNKANVKVRRLRRAGCACGSAHTEDARRLASGAPRRRRSWANMPTCWSCAKRACTVRRLCFLPRPATLAAF